MRIGRLVAISFGLLCCVGNSSIQAAGKVVVSYSSRSYAFLPAQWQWQENSSKMRIWNRC